MNLHKVISTKAQEMLTARQLEDTAVRAFLESISEYCEAAEEEKKEAEAALVKAKMVAEHSAKAKSNFLSVMSHEIRSPLNAIIGFIHLLSSEEYLPEQEEYIHAINVSSANLLSLINDILDFSRIDEGRIEFNATRFDLRDLVEKIKVSNSFAANERGNELSVVYGSDLPGFVKCDEVRLTQILNNLVSNAVKFTHRGKVTIEVTKLGETLHTEMIHFVVRDTGIGIAPQSQDRIFERFTQANSDIDRRYGGSGLGLAIVKKLLQMQGSDIHLESELGNGSVFSFSLAVQKDHQQELVSEHFLEEVHVDLTGIHILLVEDMPFNQMMANAMLKQWNASVDIADNGRVAVDLCRQKKYDLVLMDLQMPVMDGISAVKEIRCFDRDLPVIALTASASVEMQEEIRQSGFNEYVSKPFTPSNLYIKIKKCL